MCIHSHVFLTCKYLEFCFVSSDKCLSVIPHQLFECKMLYCRIMLTMVAEVYKRGSMAEWCSHWTRDREVVRSNPAGSGSSLLRHYPLSLSFCDSSP